MRKNRSWSVNGRSKTPSAPVLHPSPFAVPLGTQLAGGFREPCLGVFERPAGKGLWGHPFEGMSQQEA
jgi:hypothetical protein